MNEFGASPFDMRHLPELERSLERSNRAVENFVATSGRAFARFDEATMRSLVRPSEAAGKTLETTFGEAAKFAGGALKRLADDGRFSLEDLRKAALSALTDIVREFQRTLGRTASPDGGAGGFLARILGGGFGIPLAFRARGGPVAAGRPFVVGEKGPELFVPPSAGSIVPNRELAGASAPTVVFQIDARGAQAGVERRILRALKDVEQRTVARSVAAVRDARLRGGAFAASFR